MDIMAAQKDSPTKLRRKSREREQSGIMMGRRRDDFETAIRPYKKGSGMVFKQLKRLLAMRPTNVVAQMIIISINGTQFYLKRSTCIRIPLLSKLLTRPSRSTGALQDHDTRSMSLYEQLQRKREPKKMLQFSFEKNSAVFAAVVDFVQNHELHAPQVVCPKLFARDLRFWGFDVGDLEPCCYARVLRYLYEQDKLQVFQGFLKKSQDTEDQLQMSSGRMTRKKWIRKTVWHILEHPFSSWFARVSTCK